MPKRLSVAISQGQSQHPAKRELEEELVAALMMEPGIEVTILPHLYDLTPDSTGVMALQGIGHDLLVISWLYERAARWTLDRHDVRGRIGVCQLIRAVSDEDEDDIGDEADSEEDKRRVIADRDIPDRRVYCLDFSAAQSVEDFVVEVRRIRDELATDVVQLASWIGGTPKQDQLQRYVSPSNDTALGPSQRQSDEGTLVARVDETPDRRWYPVIDFSRCTNCMECIDFCLFGVYGIDQAETILVEQPDNCRKGCPACSRVCPENAIIFPQHKSPAIAGAGPGQCFQDRFIPSVWGSGCSRGGGSRAR